MPSHLAPPDEGRIDDMWLSTKSGQNKVDSQLLSNPAAGVAVNAQEAWVSTALVRLFRHEPEWAGRLASA